MRLAISEVDKPEGDDLDPHGAVAYLYLTRHPATPGCVKKQVRLLDLIDGYVGPDIYLDFDASNELIGMDILED